LTELIWEGKYDKDGHKVAPLRVRLPFQTVETVNESAQERQRTLDLFGRGRPSDWRNRLIWGDKKYVLPALLEEFAGQVNLIYIDPPFDTGQDFSFQVNVNDEDFIKAPSIIEQKAYRDTWGVSPEERAAGKTHVDKYLQWFYETIVLLRELLAETGSIYVHCDYRINSAVRLVLDEVFGTSNMQNEIVWCYRGMAVSKQHYVRRHDNIYFYTKSGAYTFNWAAIAVGLTEATRKKYKYVDKDGRRFRLHGRNISGSPIQNHTDIQLKWLHSHPELCRIDYLDEKEGAKPRDWFELDYLNVMSDERVGFETQKPEAVLERIISASSNEGDLVLDCFVGSGTTAVVAEKLGRRWVACDLGRFAIHTTRKRLLSVQGIRPFIVQNLGKYERQLWQAAEFGEQAEERMLAYRRFILDLYHAQPINGYSWLHGVKAGRMVHVGAVDSPVSPGDVAQIAAEFKRAVGTGQDAPKTNGVDVLGWDFAFELNEVAKQQAAQANINMRFLRIPREVLEKKAVEQGDIRFFELAALSVAMQQKGRSVTLKLTDFVIPPDDVPEDVRRTITNWEQWIDYWAVDWNNQGDTFHNEWQDYRTRKKRELQRVTSHTYEQPGTYTIVVKVIDILGNDTTKTLKVEVH
jgi:DNA modification methylase